MADHVANHRVVNLMDHIDEALQESQFPTPRSGYFAPNNTLTAVTHSSVIKTIGSNQKLDNQLVDFTSGKAREIFAIGICMGMGTQDLVEMMRHFMKHDKNDSNLPIIDPDAAAIWPRAWARARRREFRDKQHYFRPQAFPRRERFHVSHVKSNVVFPILESQQKIGGQFGIIYKIKIHKQCLDADDPIRKAHGVAAIKELRESIEGDKAKRAWEREVKALQRICRIGLLHVVEIAAMISHGKKQYFLFPWADGGNLYNLWKSRDSYEHRSDIASRHIPHIVDQLVGLTGALKRLHCFTYGNAASYRHGDLKPENILVFHDGNPTFPGVWKLADLGLARYHVAATNERPLTLSNSGAGTMSYQPPESINPRSAATSRLYDIWSIGCILLQLMTWLVYGKGKIDELTRTTTPSAFAHDQSSYWTAELNHKRGYHNFRIHPAIKIHMAQMKHDIKGSKALQQLLHIIQDKLLVIDRPTKATVSEPGRRVNAADLHESLRRIQTACRDSRYYYSGNNIVKRSSLLQIPQPQVPAVAKGKKLNDNWVRFADKSFVLTLLSRPELLDSIASDTIPKAKLCMKCANMDFVVDNFGITDTFQELRRGAGLCDFCKMRWKVAKDAFSHDIRSVQFDLVDSDLQLNHRPVISFLAYREGSDIELSVDHPTENWPQIGLPRLPPISSEAHFTILRDWLQECDEHHKNCTPLENANARLPTRLLDVGERGESGVRLYETQKDDTLEYFALSHPWGTNRASHFCTYPETLDDHMQGIFLEDLPQTFQDAVEVTRSLNQRYLWIDSLCIVQGPNGDFNEQAKHMEGVFRQAYCVLAASCAEGQQDGFMKPRDERHCLKIEQNFPGRTPVYACDFIDNFQEHALDSHLNKRGWVLQERALARRTIFFTEKQTYWECGEGVRCETTMKMNNKLASFLGDSRFPEVGMTSTHGSKIRLYQDLYSKYSRLELSYEADRPVAIAGIEKQLIASFNVRGGFGVLDDGRRGLLWRSLLWQRGKDTSSGLRKIDFESLQGVNAAIIQPPSWSWMAYTGAIDYLDLPFDGVDWEENDICSRWSRGSGKSWTYSGDCSKCPLELTVHARSFKFQAAKTSQLDTVSIAIDTPERADELEPSLKCVVLGRLRDQTKEAGNARHYVLLVTTAASNEEGSAPSVNRVGVGYLPGALIDFDEQGVRVELR